MEWHANGARAWYVDRMRIAPVLLPYVTGSVALGGAVNFNEIRFNPHGHGTHTETVGHIAKTEYPISAIKLPFLMPTRLITIRPEEYEHTFRGQRAKDLWVTKAQLIQALQDHRPTALVVRTTPNTADKCTINYSGTNFCYFEPAGLAWLAEIGVQHLLVDLPSVDREEDEGLLLAHRAFWQYPANTRTEATITELVYIPDQIIDGAYLLHLGIMPLRNDAAPSTPTLFACHSQM